MTTPDVRSVRRAQCWLNVRNDSPMRVPPAQSLTASRHAGQRAVAVAVAEQAGDARQPRPEHERLGPDLGGGRQRLDEPQQQPRVALHRAGDVAEDDERARLADRPPPDPRHELAAGPEVAPEHRPRREPPAVRVELVAAGPAPLEPRDEQVDEPLGLAQLGRGHPVELAVAQDLALAVGVGRDDDALDRRRRRRRPRRRRTGSGCRARRAAAPIASVPGARLGRAVPPARPRRGVVRARRAAAARSRRAAGVPRGATSGRRPRRRSRGRRAAGRRSPRPAARTCSRSPMSTRVRARAKSTAAPRSMDSRAARSARPNPTASPSRRRPSTSAPERRLDDGGVGHRVAPLSRRRRPRRGCAGRRRRGPGGCPPRT